MSKERTRTGAPPEGIISIIGPGMVVVGDCETDGTLRVEGTVRGSITAGKAVVVGKEGVVDGDVLTEDAVVAGHVTGTLVAGSRLELQSTSRIDGDVRARRMRLEEGALLNGTVLMGEAAAQKIHSHPDAVASGEVVENVPAVAVAVPHQPQLPPGSTARGNGPARDSPDTGDGAATPQSPKGGTSPQVNRPPVHSTTQPGAVEKRVQE
ncbi:MAG: polymer-forming cytoskeletal protein [Gemmatimonadota bacterium]